jgi:hypothetical protein
MQEACDATTVCDRGLRMKKLSIRRNWTAYADMLLNDETIVSSKAGRMFCRTIAHGAFYAGAHVRQHLQGAPGRASDAAPQELRPR